MPFDNATVTTPTIEFLRRMLDTLSPPRTWIRDDLDNGHGGRCLLGTIAWLDTQRSRSSINEWSPTARNACEALTLEISPTVAQELRELRAAKPNQYGIHPADKLLYSAITSFNDRSSRRRRDVLHKISETIDTLTARALTARSTRKPVDGLAGVATPVTAQTPPRTRQGRATARVKVPEIA